jgi:Fe-S-cluster containining protein
LANDPGPHDIGDGVTITCASCRACCCRLEVILMGDDDVPEQFTESDRWGGQVMARLDDGWCAALDRNTMLCRIYPLRPMVCRDFQVGAAECLTERRALGDAQAQGPGLNGCR